MCYRDIISSILFAVTTSFPQNHEYLLITERQRHAETLVLFYSFISYNFIFIEIKCGNLVTLLLTITTRLL